MSNAKSKVIKEAISGMTRRTVHLGKKGAPGIYYDKLTPKEKYYRNNNQSRTNKRLEKFEKSPYGQHLKARAERRGETDL